MFINFNSSIIKHDGWSTESWRNAITTINRIQHGSTIITKSNGRNRLANFSTVTAILLHAIATTIIKQLSKTVLTMNEI